MITTYEQLQAALKAWHEKTDNFYCEEITLRIYAGEYEYGLRYDGASSHALDELESTLFNLPISHEDFEELINNFSDEVDEAENEDEDGDE
jgi:hypothetical protein